jgi:hypothetical protein
MALSRPILGYGKPFEVESSRDLVLESSQRLGRPLLLGAGKSRAIKTGNAVRGVVRLSDHSLDGLRDDGGFVLDRAHTMKTE